METSPKPIDDYAVSILAKLEAANHARTLQEPGAREKMLALSQQLTAALETPSELIQRVGWAEVGRNIARFQGISS